MHVVACSIWAVKKNVDPDALMAFLTSKEMTGDNAAENYMFSMYLTVTIFTTVGSCPHPSYFPPLPSMPFFSLTAHRFRRVCALAKVLAPCYDLILRKIREWSVGRFLMLACPLFPVPIFKPFLIQ